MKKPLLRLAVVLLMLVPVLSYAQTVISDSIIHDGGYRNYILNLPPSYNGNEEMPLVYVLHGGGNSDGLTFKNKYQFDEIGNTENFITVFPSAIVSWAVGSGYSAGDSANVDDVGFLTTLKDSLMEVYAIDSNRVYVVGASKGGLMTQRLACQAPHEFTAFAAIAANMPDSALYVCNPQQSVPILVMNGTEDPLMYYDGGQGPPETDGGWIISTDSVINFWRSHNGCAATSPNVYNFPDTQTGDSSIIIKYDYGICADASEVILYKVVGGGHNIPTLAPVSLNPSPITGWTNRDIQGELEVWNFFKKHNSAYTDITGVTETNLVLPISVYPNPFSRQAILQTDHFLNNATLTLVNCLGKTVLQVSDICGQTIPLNRNNLASGLYFIRLTQGGEIIGVGKIVVAD